MRETTIRADAPFEKIDYKELHAFRWVFWMLILRDIKLRYKQTVLGVAWVILQPLITALIFSLVFGRMIKLESDGVPYLLFAFCGLVPWLTFSQGLQRASMSLIGDARLITKVYFPRIFIPLSATFGVIIDFCISLFLVFVMMTLFHQPLTTNVVFLPLGIVVLFAFSSGVNLIFSSLNVFYRDFKHIIPFLVQIWMYASPLVYSGNIIPERYRLIYSLNPMAGIIDFFRWAILGTGSFPAYSFSVAATASVLAFGGGVYLFRKLENFFADVI